MNSNVRLESLTPDQLESYQSVSIAYEISSRVDLRYLREASTLREVPETPRLKDYDANVDSRPTILPSWFDLSNWLILSAFEGGQRIAGTIVARDTPNLHLLEGRRDLSLVFDLRVGPNWRGKGIGRMLFQYAIDWSLMNGCKELRVETQDVNVAACRFYQAMGCTLHSASEGAYGPELDEAMLIWQLILTA